MSVLNQKIQDIADAATYLFLQQGYSKTQISHIAKAINVSVGTIYLNFAGKQEIMQYILKSTIEPDFMNQEFQRPIQGNLFTDLENEIVLRLEQTAREFSQYLENSSAYTFEELISDAFDLLSKYAVGCLFIEKNQFDFKFLAGRYKQYRTHFLNTMKQYLILFMEKGLVRSLEDVDLTSTLIVEILTWWAMDMRYTAFETSNISFERAKKVCMDNIVSAYKIN